MRELYKMSEGEKSMFQLPMQDNYYCFKDDKEMFGFAKIDYLEKIDIYIFILKNKRGNGYGKELFSKVLQKLKEYGIHFIEIELPLSDIIMSRIINSNGGIEDTRKEGIVKYVLPII